PARSARDLKVADVIAFGHQQFQGHPSRLESSAGLVAEQDANVVRRIGLDRRELELLPGSRGRNHQSREHPKESMETHGSSILPRLPYIYSLRNERFRKPRRPDGFNAEEQTASATQELASRRAPAHAIVPLGPAVRPPSLVSEPVDSGVE